MSYGIHMRAIWQEDIYPRYEFENYLFKIIATPPRDQ